MTLSSPPPVTMLDADELAALLEKKPDLQLLDVRGYAEYVQLGHIAGATLLPLQDIESWAPLLDPQQEAVVLCQHGVRSLHACQYLQSKGFSKLFNLDGGLVTWNGSLSYDEPERGTCA